MPGWFPNTVSSVLDLLLDGAYHVIISPYILGEEKSSLIEYISRNGYMICFFYLKTITFDILNIYKILSRRVFSKFSYIVPLLMLHNFF